MPDICFESGTFPKTIIPSSFETNNETKEGKTAVVYIIE